MSHFSEYDLLTEIEKILEGVDYQTLNSKKVRHQLEEKHLCSFACRKKEISTIFREIICSRRQAEGANAVCVSSDDEDESVDGRDKFWLRHPKASATPVPNLQPFKVTTRPVKTQIRPITTEEESSGESDISDEEYLPSKSFNSKARKTRLAARKRKVKAKTIRILAKAKRAKDELHRKQMKVEEKWEWARKFEAALTLASLSSEGNDIRST